MEDNDYGIQKRVDGLLDKISKHGISALSKLEIDFLDSFKNGEELEYLKILLKDEADRTFIDDLGIFKFEYINKEVKRNKKTSEIETHYIGIIYCPDLKLSSGRRIPGRMVGKIVLLNDGFIIPEFFIKNEKYDLYDFCEGLEYELDIFFDFVVNEIQERQK